MVRYLNWTSLARFLFAVCLPLSGAATPVLEIHVETHKDTIALGEPLVVSTGVQNKTAVAVEIYYQNSPKYEMRQDPITLLRISPDDPTAKTSHYGTWSDAFTPVERRMPATLTFLPGQEVTFKQVVLFQRREGFAFEKPGRYWISAKAVVMATPGEQPPSFDIEAEPVAITVREPEGRDRAVWEWLDSHKEDYGRLIQIPWMAKLPDEFVDECSELAATSDSVYAEYLPLFLSRWYGEGPGKDPREAARFAEIATAKASSGILKTLAARNAGRVAKEVQAQALRELAESEKKKRAGRPVEPAVRREAEGVLRGLIAAMAAGDLDRCMELTAEDYRGWSRARQREEFQEEIDKLENLRLQGIAAEVSTRVFSVVGIGKDVEVTAILTLRRGSEPPEENTVRCRVRKYGDRWLLQDWR